MLPISPRGLCHYIACPSVYAVSQLGVDRVRLRCSRGWRRNARASSIATGARRVSRQHVISLSLVLYAPLVRENPTDPGQIGAYTKRGGSRIAVKHTAPAQKVDAHSPFPPQVPGSGEGLAALPAASNEGPGQCAGSPVPWPATLGSEIPLCVDRAAGSLSRVPLQAWDVSCLRGERSPAHERLFRQ